MASIRNRDGRWQARVSRKGFPTEVRSFDSRAAATKWARAIEASIDAGNHIGPSGIAQMSLKQLLERYKAEVTPTKRGAADEEIRLTAMMRRRLAGFNMANLTPERVAEFRDERLRSVGRATVIRDLSLLSGVIAHARREWGLTTQNPCALVRKPVTPPGRDRVLTFQEEERLLAAIVPTGRKNKLMPFIVRLALETAMRRGELLATRWENIDLDARTIHLAITKNGDARVVPLSTRAQQTLIDMEPKQSGVVFPITVAALDRAFRVGCVRAGIADLRFHDLRHTATSRMAKKLPNLIELSAVTGHKTMQMLKRYYHPKASDLALKLG
jgi:integrase